MSPALSAPPARPQSRLDKVLNDFAKQCDISTSNIQDVYPCTPLQQGLVALSETSHGAYMAQHVYKLHSDVDHERMIQAWNTVVQRHAILRTRILLIGENAMQVVVKKDEDQWGDCSDLHSYLNTDQQAPPQTGERLSRLAISRCYLVWSAHHSIYDGFSVEIILHDVATAYRDGDIPPRPSFRHFIERTFQKKQKEQTEAYWRSKLNGVGEVASFPRLPAPSYRPQPNRTYQHGSTLAIDGLSNVTMSTIVQAAWALVQASHLGTTKTTFGTTLSGRNTNIADIEKIVGPTLATVPVYLNLEHNTTIRDYLRATQSYFTDMIPHQQIGLQNLKKLNPEIADICNFQTLLAFQSAKIVGPQSPYSDLFEAENQSDLGASFYNYALTVQCSLERNGAFKLFASYDDTLISEVQIKRHILQFEHIILQLMTRDGSERLKDIDLISPQDLEQLDLWDCKSIEYPGKQPLDAIRQHVVSSPNAIAISSWDGTLTYEELDDYASKLAYWLIKTRDVSPETVVPICFDRSKWMIVSILAVMKAGGAFLLLDPIYPEERLNSMICMVNAKTIMVSDSCKGKFGAFDGLAQPVGSTFFEAHAYVAAPLPQECDLPIDRAMYLIFTSGSTGQPKGVIITHKSYAVSAAGHIPALGLDADTRQLFFASPAFDLSIYETIGSLMAGSTICIPTEEDRNGSVSSIIQSMGVNMISLTSSYARHMVPEEVPDLKTLALVGEPLARDVQRIWADNVCLINAYGPSECSVVTNVKKPVTHDSNPANIGPVTTGRAWIVDPNDFHSLLPIGATGEMLIEGDHLGRGYLNDPEKTVSSFVFSPRWAAEGESSEPRRFYKTGDLVHFAEDGSLIIEGRKDSQVKIRGQRVEIAEIEYHLAKLFDQAAGVAVEAFKCDNQVQLVAFLFCDETNWDGSKTPGKTLQHLGDLNVSSLSDIKMHLKKVLPYHMVPSRYQVWPRIPVMVSGKLDRKALVAELRAPSGIAIELDETDAEFPVIEASNEVALNLNQRILGLTMGEKTASLDGRDFPLSILGLDSIQLIRVVTFIRQEYGTKMVVGTLYDLKLTVTGLAALVTEIQTKGTDPIIAPKLDLSKELQVVYKELTRRSECAKHKRRVFLTGATGLLGSQILRQLLTDPNVRQIIVHVRATNAAKGLARVVSTATLAKWWLPSYANRVECWPGDLKEPQLGLHPDHWRMLCGASEPETRITSIIHNGAAVQWQAPYSALKAVNVDSTVDLLTAVMQWSEAGSFTFVSGGLKRSSSDDLESFLKALEQANGYSQSKFIAEELVSRFAGHQSLHRVSIVRPGWVIGTEQEAVPNTDDFLWTLVQACVQIGSYPAEGGDLWLAVADVEEVSTRVLATTFAASGESPSIDNVEDGTTVAHFWELIKEKFDKKLTALSNESWKEAAQNFVQNQQSGQSRFLPILAMLQDPQMGFGVPCPSYVKSIKLVDGALRSNIQSLKDAGFFSSQQDSSASLKLFSRSRVNESAPGISA